MFQIYVVSLYQQKGNNNHLKNSIMKTNEKRFRTTEIVTYRKSNSTKVVSFDTIEEATAHVYKEKQLHPRSKKFNPIVFDSVEKKSVRV